MKLSLLKAIILLLALTSLVQACGRCSCNTDPEESTEYPYCNHDKFQAENPIELCDVKEHRIQLTKPGKGSLTTGATATADSDVTISADGDVTTLALTDYPPLRMYANYDRLTQEAPAAFSAYFRNILGPAVISYFQGALRVKYPVTGPLRVTTNTICGQTTPTDLRNGVDTDFYVLFNSYSQSSGIVATTSTCQQAAGSRRPVVGYTTINRYQMQAANGNAIIHEKNIYQLLHELTHTFGFSRFLYSSFVDVNGNPLTGHVKTATVGGTSQTVIDVAPLTAKLRTFHNCQTIPGAIMESGDDSHWDKKRYLFELMQSGAISGKRVSEFSLGMIEASGWYLVDYTYAEPYYYAQNQGCSFLNSACTNSGNVFNEFCTGSSKGCSFMGDVGGFCNSGSNMDGCRYVIPNDNYSCENTAALSNARLPAAEAYGLDAGSKCFTGTLYTRSSTTPNSFCFKYNCVGTGTATQLQVTVGNTVVTCTQQGSITVPGYFGSLNCPNPQTFCNTVGKQFCPRGCMGRGNCVNNKCQCSAGFTGLDCGFPL